MKNVKIGSKVRVSMESVVNPENAQNAWGTVVEIYVESDPKRPSRDINSFLVDFGGTDELESSELVFRRDILEVKHSGGQVRLTLKKIDVRKFDWTGDHGISEISDLGTRILTDRIYDDACDCGFLLVNPRTRVEKLMVLLGPFGPKNDAPEGWSFRASDNSVVVDIYND